MTLDSASAFLAFLGVLGTWASANFFYRLDWTAGVREELRRKELERYQNFRAVTLMALAPLARPAMAGQWGWVFTAAIFLLGPVLGVALRLARRPRPNARDLAED